MQGERAGARGRKETRSPSRAGHSRRKPATTTTGSAEQVAPNVLSIEPWERNLEGELYAATVRVDSRFSVP